MNKQFMTSPQGRFQIPCTEIISNQQRKNMTQSITLTAITLKDAVWKPGDTGTITVTFGGYGCDGCSPDASWSQIGKHSSDNFPSMNLGFIDPPYTSFTLNGVSYTAPPSATRNYCGSTGASSCTSGWVPGATVIHEFGHALGMLHEHQNNLENSNPIKLNKDAVIAYYNKIGMGESGAVTNVLDTYSCTPGVDCLYSGTKFDPKSIMLYALPDDWVIGPNPTSPNFVLSSQDISWLQQQYPKTTTDPPVLTVKFIDQNPEPWKVAWVQKTITETYGPLLGVKWNFDTQSILKNTTTTKPTTTTTTTTTTTKPTTVSTIVNIPVDSNGNIPGTVLKPGEFIAAIIVPLLLLIIALVALYINRHNLTNLYPFAYNPRSYNPYPPFN
jgi:hypothetical protein